MNAENFIFDPSTLSENAVSVDIGFPEGGPKALNVNPPDPKEAVVRNIWHGSNKAFDSFDLSYAGENTSTSFENRKTGETIQGDMTDAMFACDSIEAAVCYAFMAQYLEFERIGRTFEHLYPLFNAKKNYDYNNRESLLNDLKAASKYIPEIKEHILDSLAPEEKLLGRIYNLPEDVLADIAVNLFSLRTQYLSKTRAMDRNGLSNMFNNLSEQIKWLEYFKINGDRFIANDPTLLNRFGTFDTHTASFYNDVSDSIVISKDDERYFYQITGEEKVYFDTLKSEDLNAFWGRVEAVNKRLEQKFLDEVKTLGYNDNFYLYRVNMAFSNPLVLDYLGSGIKEPFKGTEIPAEYVTARQALTARTNGNDGIIYFNVKDPFLMNSYGSFNAENIQIEERLNSIESALEKAKEQAKTKKQFVFQFARTSENGYEVSSKGDRRFSALFARFAEGTLIEGKDVGGLTIEEVYQKVMKHSGKGQAPTQESPIGSWREQKDYWEGWAPESLVKTMERAIENGTSLTKTDLEDISYYRGYLPLWQIWARQNYELLNELRVVAEGKVLTDKFATTGVSQARALADILNNEGTIDIALIGASAGKSYKISEEEVNYLKVVSRKFDDSISLTDNGLVYSLGYPCSILASTGFPTLDPIELSSKQLRAKCNKHGFSPKDIKGLVLALNSPLAIFSYGKKEQAQNVIVELSKDGKNFLIGVHFKMQFRGVEVSDIRGLFNRTNSDWVNWINDGKLLYADKKRIQALISKQGSNFPEITKKNLNRIANIVNSFENPKPIIVDVREYIHRECEDLAQTVSFRIENGGLTPHSAASEIIKTYLEFNGRFDDTTIREMMEMVNTWCPTLSPEIESILKEESFDNSYFIGENKEQVMSAIKNTEPKNTNIMGKTKAIKIPDIYSIGHSNLSIEQFVDNLHKNGITAVVDVRSTPYSKAVPSFNKESLEKALADEGIRYFHMPEAFGARRDDALTDGQVDWQKVQALPAFAAGVAEVDRLRSEGQIVSFMCSEGDPLKCHRFGMVTEYFARRGDDVRHIRTDGTVITNGELESEMISEYVNKGRLDAVSESYSAAEQRRDAYRILNGEYGYGKQHKGLSFAKGLFSEEIKTDNIMETNQTTPSIVIKFYDNSLTRLAASRLKDTTGVYTENAEPRDSGKNPIAGTGKHFPSVTTARMRLLEGWYPVTTQHYYLPDKKGETGRWNDEDFEQFKNIIDSDFDSLRRALVERASAGTGEHTLLLPSTDGFTNGKISAITEERTPVLYRYLKVQESALKQLVEGYNRIVADEGLQREGLVSEELNKLLNGCQKQIDADFDELLEDAGLKAESGKVESKEVIMPEADNAPSESQQPEPIPAPSSSSEKEETSPVSDNISEDSDVIPSIWFRSLSSDDMLSVLNNYATGDDEVKIKANYLKEGWQEGKTEYLLRETMLNAFNDFSSESRSRILKEAGAVITDSVEKKVVTFVCVGNFKNGEELFKEMPKNADTLIYTHFAAKPGQAERGLNFESIKNQYRHRIGNKFMFTARTLSGEPVGGYNSETAAACRVAGTAVTAEIYDPIKLSQTAVQRVNGEIYNTVEEFNTVADNVNVGHKVVIISPDGAPSRAGFINTMQLLSRQGIESEVLFSDESGQVHRISRYNIIRNKLEALRLRIESGSSNAVMFDRTWKTYIDGERAVLKKKGIAGTETVVTNRPNYGKAVEFKETGKPILFRDRDLVDQTDVTINLDTHASFSEQIRRAKKTDKLTQRYITNNKEQFTDESYPISLARSLAAQVYNRYRKSTSGNRHLEKRTSDAIINITGATDARLEASLRFLPPTASELDGEAQETNDDVVVTAHQQHAKRESTTIASPTLSGISSDDSELFMVRFLTELEKMNFLIKDRYNVYRLGSDVYAALNELRENLNKLPHNENSEGEYKSAINAITSTLESLGITTSEEDRKALLLLKELTDNFSHPSINGEDADYLRNEMVGLLEKISENSLRTPFTVRFEDMKQFFLRMVQSVDLSEAENASLVEKVNDISLKTVPLNETDIKTELEELIQNIQYKFNMSSETAEGLRIVNNMAPEFERINNIVIESPEAYKFEASSLHKWVLQDILKAPDTALAEQLASFGISYNEFIPLMNALKDYILNTKGYVAALNKAPINVETILQARAMEPKNLFEQKSNWQERIAANPEMKLSPEYKAMSPSKKHFFESTARGVEELDAEAQEYVQTMMANAEAKAITALFKEGCKATMKSKITILPEVAEAKDGHLLFLVVNENEQYHLYDPATNALATGYKWSKSRPSKGGESLTRPFSEEEQERTIDDAITVTKHGKKHKKTIWNKTVLSVYQERIDNAVWNNTYAWKAVLSEAIISSDGSRYKLQRDNDGNYTLYDSNNAVLVSGGKLRYGLPGFTMQVQKLTNEDKEAAASLSIEATGKVVTPDGKTYFIAGDKLYNALTMRCETAHIEDGRSVFLPITEKPLPPREEVVNSHLDRLMDYWQALCNLWITGTGKDIEAETGEEREVPLYACFHIGEVHTASNTGIERDALIATQYLMSQGWDTKAVPEYDRDFTVKGIANGTPEGYVYKSEAMAKNPYNDPSKRPLRSLEDVRAEYGSVEEQYIGYGLTRMQFLVLQEIGFRDSTIAAVQNQALSSKKAYKSMNEIVSDIAGMGFIDDDAKGFSDTHYKFCEAKVKQALDELHEKHFDVITRSDSRFPVLLTEVSDMEGTISEALKAYTPEALYYRGNLKLLDGPTTAIRGEANSVSMDTGLEDTVFTERTGENRGVASSAKLLGRELADHRVTTVIDSRQKLSLVAAREAMRYGGKVILYAAQGMENDADKELIEEVERNGGLVISACLNRNSISDLAANEQYEIKRANYIVNRMGRMLVYTDARKGKAKNRIMDLAATAGTFFLQYGALSNNEEIVYNSGKKELQEKGALPIPVTSEGLARICAMAQNNSRQADIDKTAESKIVVEKPEVMHFSALRRGSKQAFVVEAKYQHPDVIKTIKDNYYDVNKEGAQIFSSITDACSYLGCSEDEIFEHRPFSDPVYSAPLLYSFGNIYSTILAPDGVPGTALSEAERKRNLSVFTEIKKGAKAIEAEFRSRLAADLGVPAVPDIRLPETFTMEISARKITGFLGDKVAFSIFLNHEGALVIRNSNLRSFGDLHDPELVESKDEGRSRIIDRGRDVTDSITMKSVLTNKYEHISDSTTQSVLDDISIAMLDTKYGKDFKEITGANGFENLNNARQAIEQMKAEGSVSILIPSPLYKEDRETVYGLIYKEMAGLKAQKDELEKEKDNIQTKIDSLNATPDELGYSSSLVEDREKTKGLYVELNTLTEQIEDISDRIDNLTVALIKAKQSADNISIGYEKADIKDGYIIFIDGESIEVGASMPDSKTKLAARKAADELINSELYERNTFKELNAIVESPGSPAAKKGAANYLGYLSFMDLKQVIAKGDVSELLERDDCNKVFDTIDALESEYNKRIDKSTSDAEKADLKKEASIVIGKAIASGPYPIAAAYLKAARKLGVKPEARIFNPPTVKAAGQNVSKGK